MSKLDKPTIAFNHDQIVTMVLTHNTRAACIRKYGAQVTGNVIDFPRLVDSLPGVRAAYDSGGIFLALKGLQVLGEYSEEVRSFAAYCTGQARDLLCDERRESFASIGCQIWITTYEHVYKSISGLSLVAADSIASADAALAVYDGYYAYAVNQSFANTDFGASDVNTFEVAGASKAAFAVSEYQKIEFNRILDSIRI
jgi:hypothetical protein